MTGTYVALGLEHILGGIDHLLFVCVLLLLVRDRRNLPWTLAAFNVALSFALAAATLGVVHVPPPPVEASIALGIAILATELVHVARGWPGRIARWPWCVAFVFGLLHGLGLAGPLAEVGLPRNAIPWALLSFNLGVVCGQIAFIAVVLGLAAAWRRTRLPRLAWPRTATAYAIGGVAMCWTLQRIAQS